MPFIKIKKNLAGSGALSLCRRSTVFPARAGRHRIVGSVSTGHSTPSRPATHRAFARWWAEKQIHDALPAARFRKDVRVVKAKLRGLVTADEMKRWLVTHNSAFGGRTPIEAIYRGETGRVLEALARLEQGIFV